MAPCLTSRLLVALCSALGAWPALAAASFSGGTPPNIVVVVLDDIGPERLDFYGSGPTPATTPVLSKLASRGVVFQNAWANPICSPTRATIQTGLYAIHSGIGENPSKADPGLPVGTMVLPDRLPLAYTPVVVGKWHLADGTQGPTHPNDLGYQLYSGSLTNLTWAGGDYFEWRQTLNGSTYRADTYAPTVNIHDALRAVDLLPRPFLLHVNFNSIHTPLHAPPPELHTQNLPPNPSDDPIAYVNAMAEAADTELGRLLGTLPPNTYVIVVGDNGPFSGAVEPPLDPNRVKGTLYQGGIHVPMFIAGPGIAPGRVNALVGVVDLFATILELSGIKDLPKTDSISLVPYFTDRTLSLRKYNYSERFTPNGVNNPFYLTRERAARDRQYKLIRRQGKVDEFYDLLADPYELTDLLQAGLTPDQQTALTRISTFMEGL